MSMDLFWDWRGPTLLRFSPLFSVMKVEMDLETSYKSYLYKSKTLEWTIEILELIVVG